MLTYPTFLENKRALAQYIREYDVTLSNNNTPAAYRRNNTYCKLFY